MAPCNVLQRKQKLISDLEDLINCIKISPSERPCSKQDSSPRKKLVCTPYPSSDGKKKKKSKECDDWKADRYKSRELKGGVLHVGCQCLRRDGLQQDCQRTDCKGRPPCLIKPWPDCLPSGGTGLGGLPPRVSKFPYKPAPCPPDPCPPADCPPADFPPGVPEDPCHRAEVDCKKCVPVQMCRPGELWECTEGKCPPNPTQPPRPPGKNGLASAERKEAGGTLARKQRDVGCPRKERHQRPGYESPTQRLCRPADPQPAQRTVHSAGACCDPPAHVLKKPTYEELPAVPECPRPKTVHHPNGKILPDVTQLLGGRLLIRCDCLKNNGMQDDCRLRACGIPECLLRPPECLPSGGPGPRPRRPDAGAGDGASPDLSKCPAGFKPYVCFLPCDDDDDDDEDSTEC